jgi:hypothetical protein
MSRSKARFLQENYHPDAVAYMLGKHGPEVTHKEAEVADQEWAANRAYQFSQGKGRIDTQSAEALMQEPPLGASVPAKRSEEFEYAKKNVGLEGMATSESPSEGPAAKTRSMEK